MFLWSKNFPIALSKSIGLDAGGAKSSLVSEEENGEPVSDEQVRKVFQDRIVKPDHPNRPMEIMERRRVQKQKLPEQRPVMTLVSKQTEVKKENTLTDLSLAEIFPKAA